MFKPTTAPHLFADLLSKPVVARFEVEHGSSDGGAVRLKAADRRLDLVDGLAGCIVDRHEASRHEAALFHAQRALAIWEAVFRAVPDHQLLRDASYELASTLTALGEFAGPPRRVKPSGIAVVQ